MEEKNVLKMALWRKREDIGVNVFAKLNRLIRRLCESVIMGIVFIRVWNS